MIKTLILIGVIIFCVIIVAYLFWLDHMIMCRSILIEGYFDKAWLNENTHNKVMDSYRECIQ